MSSSSSSSSSTSCFRFSTSIPFSWEKHPGIPRAGPDLSNASPNPALPPPPPLRVSDTSLLFPKKKKASHHGEPGFAEDPFAAALMECTKRGERSKTGSAPPTSKRRSVADKFLLGLRSFDPYGSCKSGGSPVAESTVYVPLPNRALLAHGVLYRRPD